MQLAVNDDLIVNQMDCNLHAPIGYDIYVCQTKAYEVLNEKNEKGNGKGRGKSNGMLFKLKSLHGLKQSGSDRNNLLCSNLCDIGFTKPNVDPCIFARNENTYLTIVLVWVDDIIILSHSQNVIKETKSKLSSKFNTKDLGELSNILGIRFNVTKESIFMDQFFYLENVLKHFNLYGEKGRSTCCKINLSSYHLNNIYSDGIDITKYRQMVGRLIYAMNCTRPDLSFVGMELSQNLSNPRPSDLLFI